MSWRYKILGTHVHVDVFMNGAHCGKLCFRLEEWQQIIQNRPTIVIESA